MGLGVAQLLQADLLTATSSSAALLPTSPDEKGPPRAASPPVPVTRGAIGATSSDEAVDAATAQLLPPTSSPFQPVVDDDMNGAASCRPNESTSAATTEIAVSLPAVAPSHNGMTTVIAGGGGSILERALSEIFPAKSVEERHEVVVRGRLLPDDESDESPSRAASQADGGEENLEVETLRLRSESSRWPEGTDGTY
jgi:hypothetical protein